MNKVLNNPQMKVITKSEQETQELGRRLGRCLLPGDILGLVGGLGSGKTTLVKGIASGLRVKEEDRVCSPSFVLIKEYTGKTPLFHFDLYRLNAIKDIEGSGLKEYLFDEGVCVIEWVEKLKAFLPDYLQVNLLIKEKNKREIKFVVHSKRYERVLATLKRQQ